MPFGGWLEEGTCLKRQRWFLIGLVDFFLPTPGRSRRESGLVVLAAIIPTPCPVPSRDRRRSLSFPGGIGKLSSISSNHSLQNQPSEGRLRVPLRPAERERVGTAGGAADANLTCAEENAPRV